MSVLGCFTAKIREGIVDGKIGTPLIETIQRLEREKAATLGRAEALRSAAREAADDAALIAQRKADLALRYIEAQLDVLRNVERARQIVGERQARPASIAGNQAPVHLRTPDKSPLYDTLAAYLTGDKYEILPGQLSLFHLAQGIRGQAHGIMRDTIANLRGKMFGWKIDKALELDTLIAVLDPGAKVSEAARAAATGWRAAAEFLRKEFVDAGGALPERKGWGLPNPAHDAEKVRSATRERWVDFTDRLLNHEEMLDFETGRRLSPARRRALLEEVYDTIGTSGAAEGPSAAFKGQKALASRRAEARVLVFRNAESWLEYNREFGSGAAVLETMMSHIHSMADDIAQLRILGPNPDAMKRFMLSLFDQERIRLTKQGTDAAGEKAAFKVNEKTTSTLRERARDFEQLWDEVTGANSVPVNIVMAQRMGEIRAALTAARMGSAIISSFSDPMRMITYGRFYDLPGTQMIARAAEGMKDGSFELHAAQLGIVADSAAMLLHRTDRYAADVTRTGTMARVASTVISASGLRRWSGVLRATVGMEMMANMANKVKTGFDELPVAFRDMLERNGIDRGGWDVIRAATPTEPTPGGKFLTALDIRRIDHPDARRLGDLWQQTINRAMDHLVIESDPEAKLFWTRGTKPGTVAGEATRSFAMFKSFPTSLLLKDYAFLTARGWDGSRMGHAAIAMIAMTSMGMLSMQTKEVIKGKDPLSMDPTDAKGIRAWGAATLQGGGLGIFGDFFFADQTRFGNTVAATIAGPVAGAAEALIMDAVIGNVQKAAKGQPTHFAGDALYAAAALVPGSSLWYARTAFQRAVVDQLALMIDERTPQRFQRMEREAEKTWGQRFWWDPGRIDPRRAPDLTAAFGR